MQSFYPPPETPVEEAGSSVLRFGTAVGIAAAAALLSAVPATMRVSAAAAREGTGRVWLGLAAEALVPMVAAVLVLRGARVALRSFEGEGAWLRAYGAALWLTWLLVVLSFFGSVLRATTHHHALAGVTFAFGALASAVGSAAVFARAVTLLRRAAPAVQRAAAVALGFPTFAAVVWVLLRFAHAASQDNDSAAAGTVLDVFAFSLAALFAASRFVAARRAVAVIGPPVAVVIAALGLSVLRDQPLREAIDARAPMFAPLADVIAPR